MEDRQPSNSRAFRHRLRLVEGGIPSPSHSEAFHTIRTGPAWRLEYYRHRELEDNNNYGSSLAAFEERNEAIAYLCLRENPEHHAWRRSCFTIELGRLGEPHLIGPPPQASASLPRAGNKASSKSEPWAEPSSGRQSGRTHFGPAIDRLQESAPL